MKLLALSSTNQTSYTIYKHLSCSISPLSPPPLAIIPAPSLGGFLEMNSLGPMDPWVPKAFPTSSLFPPWATSSCWTKATKVIPHTKHRDPILSAKLIASSKRSWRLVGKVQRLADQLVLWRIGSSYDSCGWPRWIHCFRWIQHHIWKTVRPSGSAPDLHQLTDSLQYSLVKCNSNRHFFPGSSAKVFRSCISYLRLRVV